MSPSEKHITWEPQGGAIHMDNKTRKERIILTRKGFMTAFFYEIEQMEGKDALGMTFRRLLSLFGAPKELLERPTLPIVDKFHDDLILPFTITEGQMPPIFESVAGKRELSAYGDTLFTFQSVAFLQNFKSAMIEILTERGAHAILRRVAKRGGFAVGKKALDDYQWKELDRALDSMDKVLSYVFSVYGWGRSRTVTGRGKDNRRMLYLKCWNLYENEGLSTTKPGCVIHQSYLEGIGESLSQTYEEKSTESREVKCRAKGDDYCGFFIVQKEKDEKVIEWEELEDDWRRLDASVPLPDA